MKKIVTETVVVIEAGTKDEDKWLEKAAWFENGKNATLYFFISVFLFVCSTSIPFITLSLVIIFVVSLRDFQPLPSSSRVRAKKTLQHLPEIRLAHPI